MQSHPESIKEAWLVFGAGRCLPAFSLGEMCGDTYLSLEEPKGLWAQSR
jgi:hypothetical protein